MNDREQQIRDSWQHNAAAWADAVRNNRIESRVVASNAAVLAALAESGATRVLDIGCGEGWLIRALLEQGIAATGFDANAELVACARASGAGEYQVLDYAAFAAAPERAGGGFDAAVCNFSLLGRDIASIIRAAAAILIARGTLIIQTIHPFPDTGPHRYEDGWRLEDFASLGADFRSPMPWYFRTVGSWIREVVGNGFDLVACREPIHPETGRPLSLLLIGQKK